MLFSNKAKSEALPVQTDTDEELQSVTQSLYKQNLELANRNKTLSVLGKLYEISIQTLAPKELAQKITDVIQKDFEYERVGIVTYDKDSDTITALAFTESERFHTARSIANDFFDKHSRALVSKISFFKGMLSSKQMGYSESLEEVWGENLSKEQVKRVLTEGHARSILGYPLLADDKIQGFFIIILNRPFDELIEYDKESIRSFINVISVALDKARLYEELTISNEKLEKANDQQVILIHFITHQLKGFVTKSRNIFSMLMEGDYGPLPDTMKSMVQEGFNSDTKGAETIQEILNAANIKSGKVTFNMAPFDLRGVVDEIAKDLKPSTDSKGLALNLNIGTAPLEFVGDKVQLQNAFKNLIDNSIKYTPSGSIEVSLSKETDRIRFEIKDTGVGITPEDMTTLFTEGGHGKDSQKINVESTGFGLYIVKNIIVGHNGKVWAESEGAGKGSRFIVELPLK